LQQIVLAENLISELEIYSKNAGITYEQVGNDSIFHDPIMASAPIKKNKVGYFNIVLHGVVVVIIKNKMIPFPLISCSGA
jgi:hypothetical protein